jgi:hypothetical protein
MQMLTVLLLVGCCLTATGQTAPDYSKITWTTPTVEPAKNTKGQPVISGGMPLGNGETAVLAFPIVPLAPTPAPGPAPAPHCTGTLVEEKYCDMGSFIGCHDSSCQINNEESCKASTKAACSAAAAKECDANAECVAFSLMETTPGKFVWELAKTTSAVLKGFPDNDWTYYVSAKPWPKPSAGPPGELPLGGFQLPVSMSFLVNMATAMASDTSLFKLGMVSLITDPPLFEADLASFEQTLDLATATVTVHAATKSGRTLAISVAVDANTNTITALLNSSTPLSMTVVVQSLHPSERFTYDGGFGGPAPMSEPDAFSSTSTRVTISHRNEDTDEPAAFNYTLEQQGLVSTQVK